MGRPKMTREKYLVKYNEVISDLKSGKSIRLIAKEQNLGISTVVRLKKEFNITNVVTHQMPKKIVLKTSNPITLYNLETGVSKTWDSVKSASKEIGCCPESVYAVKNGKARLINDWSLTPEEKPIEVFEDIDDASLDDVINVAAPIIRKYQDKTGDKSIQVGRGILDRMIARTFGIQKINTNNHGFDGLYKNNILFEHKNNTYNKRNFLDGEYLDISVRRLKKFAEGSLNIITAFDGFCLPVHSVVFNSANVSDILNDGQKNFRQRAVITFDQILKSGGKVVTWMDDRRKAYLDIIREYPECGIKMSDIYTIKDAKNVVTNITSTI